MISYLYHDLTATLHRSSVNYIGFSLATKLPGVRLPATNIWVSFTKSGAFAQLQTALGFAPDYVWKEEDRLEFLFNWYEFEQAFQEAFGGYLNVTPADALVVLLEKYNYDTIKKMSRTVLVTLLRSAWKVLYGVHKLNAVSDCQVYQDVQ